MFDITINSADKGSACSGGYEHFRLCKGGATGTPDSKFYKKLTFDPITDHQHQVVEAVINNMFFMNKI